MERERKENEGERKEKPEMKENEDLRSINYQSKNVERMKVGILQTEQEGNRLIQAMEDHRTGRCFLVKRVFTEENGERTHEEEREREE